MPQAVLEVTTKFMRDPVRILVKKAESTLEGIKQFYIAIEKEDWKLDTLSDIDETVTTSHVWHWDNGSSLLSCDEEGPEYLQQRRWHWGPFVCIQKSFRSEIQR